MSFIVAIIIGAISGWLGGKIMGSDNSLIVNIILGLAGGALGGWLGRKIGIGAKGWVSSIAISVVGTCILIGIARLIFG